MRKFKKVISLFLLMIIFLSSIQNIVLGATAISKESIIKGKVIKTNVAFKDGSTSYEVEARYVYYVDSNKNSYPAYCITHGKDGVDERGDYTVDVSTVLNNDKVWRVITNGYPYKKLDGLSDYEAYFATKQAIYCVLVKGRSASQYKSLGGNGSNIVKAIAKLEKIGETGTETRKNANLQINKSGSFIEDGDYYSQTYTVTSSVDIGSYKVDKINGFPSGSFIADNEGNSKTSFASGETFKIMIPKSGLTQNINGNITVTSKCKTYPVLVGKTRIPDTQDYALTCDAYEDFTATTTLNLNTNSGKVKVIKVDAESTKPIKDVEFELSKMDGTKIATAKTDAQGIATFSNLHQGNYKLKEIATGENYILTTETLDITVEYNKTTTKTVGNFLKKGNIKINKTDSQTSEPIEGVTFDLLDLNGNVVASGTTDSKGELTFPDLKIGKYQLKETSTKSNYILNTANFEVEVEYNKTTVQNITNEYKKGSLIVNKVDKDNNKIALGNVVFDLFSNELKKVIGTYATDVNGVLTINDLRIGEYLLIEKDTGKWYELSEDTQININWNETTRVTIQNELKKGQIKVIKVDAENSEIRIPNVKFEVLDEKDNVLETIVTDSNGEALTSKYPIRDYENIKLREVETNEHYVLNGEIETIKLEESQIKEITFKNEKKKVEIEPPPKEELPKTGF